MSLSNILYRNLGFLYTFWDNFFKMRFSRCLYQTICIEIWAFYSPLEKISLKCDSNDVYVPPLCLLLFLKYLYFLVCFVYFLYTYLSSPTLQVAMV